VDDAERAPPTSCSIACTSRLGVHFAIGAEDAKRLLAGADDEELVAIVEEIDDAWESAFETDKAWDALHRCLSDGTLNVTSGEPPLNRVFFGGQVLNAAHSPASVPPDLARRYAGVGGIAWMSSSQ
jgi:hypothetical protein